MCVVLLLIEIIRDSVLAVLSALVNWEAILSKFKPANDDFVFCCFLELTISHNIKILCDSSFKGSFNMNLVLEGITLSPRTNKELFWMN